MKYVIQIVIGSVIAAAVALTIGSAFAHGATKTKVEKVRKSEIAKTTKAIVGLFDNEDGTVTLVALLCGYQVNVTFDKSVLDTPDDSKEKADIMALVEKEEKELCK